MPKASLPALTVCTRRGLAERRFDVLHGVQRNVFGTLRRGVIAVMIGDKSIEGRYPTDEHTVNRTVYVRKQRLFQLGSARCVA